jgi:2-phosphoglycerate kinase
MRNFVSQEESPFIYASTYDCRLLMKGDGTDYEKTIEGYKLQSKAVNQRLAEVLRYHYSQGDWVIVEGVHLTPDFIIS